MGSLETASARRIKRIVEKQIGGFRTAKEAIVFGNTVNSVVQGKVNGFVKFKLYIAAPNTTMAITKDWDDETILSIRFLEVEDQNTAMFILDTIAKGVSAHEQVHKCVLNLINEVVREKPQPQRIG